MIAEQKQKHDMDVSGLSNAIQDRNFLIDVRLSIADLTKDVRHLKANLAQHGQNYSEMHDDFIRLQDEVARLGKLINGNDDHHHGR